MLEAVARGGSYQHWRQLAELLTDNLNALEPATVAHIKDFFSSSRAAEAAGAAVQQAGEEAAARQQQEAQHGRAAEPAGGEQQQEEAQQQARSSGSGSGGAYSGWQLLPAEVSSDGSCEAASGKLRVVELADSEWDTFASSIAALAASKEARKDEFKRWVGGAGLCVVVVGVVGGGGGGSEVGASVWQLCQGWTAGVQQSRGLCCELACDTGVRRRLGQPADVRMPAAMCKRAGAARAAELCLGLACRAWPEAARCSPSSTQTCMYARTQLQGMQRRLPCHSRHHSPSFFPFLPMQVHGLVRQARPL
jgi:hypothetical protein